MASAVIIISPLWEGFYPESSIQSVFIAVQQVPDSTLAKQEENSYNVLLRAETDEQKC